MDSGFVARKPLLIMGEHYAPGQSVDLQGLAPDLRRRLVEFKRVVPRAVASAAADSNVAIPRREMREGTTCGDFGGRMKNGKPCGRKTPGLCQHHRLREA